MEHQTFAFKLKAADEGGKFEGIAAAYGPPADHGGDIFAVGAFRQAAASQGPHGYPLMFNHDANQLVGGVKITDTDTGLIAVGEMDLDDEPGRRVYGKLKKRLLRGLSVGWLPQPGKTDYDKDGVRIIREARLFEVSLTPLPMNDRALIFAVKSLSDARYLLKHLPDRPLEDGELEELRAIERELKSILAAVDPGPQIDPGILRDLKGLAASMKGRRVM